jgi:dTDP-4-dehydrorhamnose 3,5-epimerase-like enzyme
MDNIIVKNSGIVTLPRIVDDRDGVLCIMNSLQEIPFEIKRMYYINNLDPKSSLRGKHAHRKLRQVIFCINGCFTLTLDDGETQQDILMREDNVGVILDPMLWHTMHDFSSGCVLLVAASDYYDEADYIRNYDEFMRLVREEKK